MAVEDNIFSKFLINLLIVARVFQICKERKGPSPDNIKGETLKYCANQQAIPFAMLLQRSVDGQKIPDYSDSKE